MNKIPFDDLLLAFKTLHKVAENYDGGSDRMDPKSILIEAARRMLVEMNYQGYQKEMQANDLP
jgi:hypothetical protein